MYLERLLPALRSLGHVEVVELRQRARLRPGRAGRVRNPLRSAANALLDVAWLRVGLPRAARRADADVLHHPLPASSPGAGCAQVVTVHDVAFERLPHRYELAWRWLAGRSHRAAVASADVIVCPSQAAAADAAALLGAPRARIVVAPHGPGQELPAVVGGGEPRHFLYVGSDEPRKEVGALLEAYERYRGGAGAPLGLVLAGQAARRAGAPGTRGETDPAPRRLAELLAEAAALVHPAPVEGFGLTLIEAMAAGVPVAAIRNASAEEVCGDAALLVERGALADALERLHGDTALRKRLSAAGRERARRFSWAESARLHVQAYRRALERRATR